MSQTKVVMIQGNLIIGKVEKKEGMFIISEPLMTVPTPDGKMAFSSILSDVTDGTPIKYLGTDVIICNANKDITNEHRNITDKIRARKSGIITPQQPNNGLILP